MASVFYRTAVGATANTEVLFEGCYEDCLEYFNSVKDDYLTLNGPVEYHRTYEDTHKSIELCWHGARLALKNWVWS